jgi:hypothetical protein
VEFVEIGAVDVTLPVSDVLTELNDLELALVGGGAGDVNF